MPNVLSRYLDQTASKYNIRKDHLSKSVLGTVLCLYGIKLSYPYLQQLYNSSKGVSNAKVVVVNGGSELLLTNNNKQVSNGKVSNVTKDCQRTREETPETRPRSGPAVNKEFLLQLEKLIRLMIPSLWCVETGLLSVHTLALFTRTFVSIYVASMEGQIVKYIVRRDVRNFAFMLLKWLAVAVPATFINSMIRYLENKLALAFRFVIASATKKFDSFVLKFHSILVKISKHKTDFR